MHTIKLSQKVFNKIFQYFKWINQMPSEFREDADLDQLEYSIFGSSGVDHYLTDAIDELDVLEFSVTDYCYMVSMNTEVEQIQLSVTVDEDRVEQGESIEFIFVPQQ